MGGDTQERHGSLQVITVPVVTRSVEDIIMNIEGHAGLTFWPAKINFDQTGGINWF